ncbi:hypothetical protein Tsubulata_032089 [Turnera subulata]|uniref:Uncharacterized protein n=1 Tax=Turnera subulata TaxID=218843 RepID=A0A9Q0FAI9_9ROSI|nr:hypothetical protein Tsubulata_032089 [Turnera subulata]
MAEILLGPPISKHPPLLLHTSTTATRFTFPLIPTPKSNLHLLSMAQHSAITSSSSFSQCSCSLNSAPAAPRPAQPSLLVFSGGTAFNGVVEDLKQLTTRVAHVLPVSDDGGSTAEIVRVLGGPAVGDIRSRCLRLSDQSTAEALAVRRLLGYRLPVDAQRAKSEWYSIVEGENSLWKGVSRPYRETIQAFLVYFQNEILRRPNESFCFGNGSIGNFFFAGARIFFQSLDAAIFLFSRVSDIPPESMVLPVISTNDRLTLGCELWVLLLYLFMLEYEHTFETDAILQCIYRMAPLYGVKTKYLIQAKDTCNLLIRCYVGSGKLSLQGPAPSSIVLLLNGTRDRETSGFSASCFVTAITDALNRKYGDSHNCIENPHLIAVNIPVQPSQYVNTLLVPKDGEIPIDVQRLASQGVHDVVCMPFFDVTSYGIL